MSMTHYMELLANNQPWNLILFMAIPVILAETVAITELSILYTRKYDGIVRTINRFAGIVAGVYFVGIIIYLIIHAVIPITKAGEWRTILDVVAVGAYLLSGIPMILIALQEMGWIDRSIDSGKKLGRHAIYVAIFLVLAHVAMITGMADPSILDGNANVQMLDMHDMHGMQNMD